MDLKRYIIGTLLVGVLMALAPMSVNAAPQLYTKRGTVAISYPENEGTAIDMVGTSLSPRVTGRAEVKRSAGRTRVRLEITSLDNPLSIGGYYTTYVFWAIAPEGQADNLGELPVTSGDKREIEFTTPYKTFGLIVTAEPHGLVKLPGPAVVAENILRKNTKGGITASEIEYRGDPGSLYILDTGEAAPARGVDYGIPLSILGARRAVEIARRAHAIRYAETELREAEVRLVALEQTWPRRRNKEKEFTGEAHEVMRLAEHARSLAVERGEQARLDAERRHASETIANAQSDADRANIEAARAKEETESYRVALSRSESELAQARQRVEQAQNDADRAKASEELARIQAAHAQLEADKVRRQRDELQQRLFVSLSAILETRREARGLIVSLSDVLFDFNQASLKPGAKEKLSKLAGILLAYPGSYRMEIEGHTDAVGSDEYNLRLSESRAGSVRDYLNQAGIDSGHIVATRGMGKRQPVATNDTPEGRQMNRRVEIIIADQEKP